MIQLQKGKQICFEKEILSTGRIVSHSSAIRGLLAQVSRVSKNSLPVLILGEDGTGKKMIAKEIFKRQEAKNDCRSSADIFC